jgi:YHS domain-containing protein
MAVDPICRMNVSEKDARYASVHNGVNYYFCSAACKQEFDKNPSKYVK